MSDLAAPVVAGRELRANALYYAGALVLAVVAINLLLAGLDALTHTTAGGSWSGLVANYAASSAAGLRFAHRSGELGPATRKRLALAYLGVQLAAAVLLGLVMLALVGTAGLGELTQGMGPGVVVGLGVVGVLVGAGLSYLVSRVALRQAAKMHERMVARRAGATT